MSGFANRIIQTLVSIRNQITTHESKTTNVHGIVDTSTLVTQTDIDTSISTHSLDTTSVHGIADTSLLATKSYADSAASTAAAALVDSAPSTLDTLNELAAALGDDPNFATTVTNSIASKQSLIPLQNTEPTSPSSGDLWVDNTNSAKPILKTYDGASWVEVGSTVEADSDQIIISTRMFT